jgi:hypothetical protein
LRCEVNTRRVQRARARWTAVVALRCDAIARRRSPVFPIVPRSPDRCAPVAMKPSAQAESRERKTTKRDLCTRTVLPARPPGSPAGSLPNKHDTSAADPSATQGCLSNQEEPGSARTDASKAGTTHHPVGHMLTFAGPYEIRCTADKAQNLLGRARFGCGCSIEMILLICIEASDATRIGRP